MAIEAVREYLKQWKKENDILEFDTSSATVELAAMALNTEPGRIAKTLSFRLPEGCVLIVAAGDARIDNKKYKAEFGCKAKMLTAEEAVEFTGHAIGGVCPFAIARSDVFIVLDESLRRFDVVYPACGSSNSAIRLSLEELEQMSHAVRWVDVCKLPGTEQE